MKYRWLVLDIDGVLTDGTETVPSREKRVFLRDLDAVTAARKSGLGVAFLTGEPEEAARPLVERCGGGPAVYGAKDKGAGLRSLVERLGVSLDQVCYVGDGGRDVPALQLAGLALAPCDASVPARAAAHRVLRSPGGRGAVEEVVALLSSGNVVDVADVEAFVRDRLAASSGSQPVVTEQEAGRLVHAIEMVTACLAAGKKVVVFGDGESASDAADVAARLVGLHRVERRPLPALALGGDPTILTALARDFGADGVFERQVEAYLRSGDVAVGFSPDGRSPAVARGLAASARLGGHTIAMVGGKPGRVGAEAAVCLTFDRADTARIRKAHRGALQILCEYLDHYFAHGATSRTEAS